MPGTHHGRALRLFVAAALSWTALTRDIAAQSCGTHFKPPQTVRLPKGMGTLIAEMLEESPTFRQQWQTMVAAPQLRLEVEFNPTMSPNSARTTVRRHQYGLIVAVVELPIVGHRVELIAHEFEHVIEQIEGLDLRQSVRVRSAGVHDLGDGFETQRASDAGRQVAREWNRFIYAKGTAQHCFSGS
jgi:hypothetical protein